jgi:hypothetical protein
MKRLISAILIQTIKDLKNKQYQSDIQAFVNSEWFESLVEAISLEPAKIRTKFKTGILDTTYLHMQYR